MFLLNVYFTIYTSNNGCDVCSTVSRCHNLTSTLAPYVQRRGLRQVRSSSSSRQPPLSKMKSFDQNFMQLGHIIKSHDVFFMLIMVHMAPCLQELWPFIYENSPF